MDLIVYEYLLLLGATVMMLLSLFCATQNRDDGFSWFSKVIAVLQFGLHLSGCPLQGLPPARVAPYGWHAARISFNE